MATNARTYDTGQNLYLLIWDENNQIWDVAAEEFEAYAGGSYDDYDIAATEKGSCGYYFVTTPTGLAAGWYRLDWRVRAGASAAESDLAIAMESSYYDGTRWYAVWGIQGTKNQLDDLNDVTEAQVNSQADQALSDWGKTGFKLASDGLGLVSTWTVSITGTVSGNSTHDAAAVKTAIEAAGSKLDHVWETTEDNEGTRRFTSDALAEAPTATGGDSPNVEIDIDEITVS